MVTAVECRMLVNRVPKCSLSKYGFRASGVRTRASADRAETGLQNRFLSSVLKRPSQKVWREKAFGERFSFVSGPGQSTGLPRKPQETCHSVRRSGGRRARLVWELAEEVQLVASGLWGLVRVMRGWSASRKYPLRTSFPRCRAQHLPSPRTSTEQQFVRAFPSARRAELVQLARDLVPGLLLLLFGKRAQQIHDRRARAAHEIEVLGTAR